MSKRDDNLTRLKDHLDRFRKSGIQIIIGGNHDASTDTFEFAPL